MGSNIWAIPFNTTKKQMVIKIPPINNYCTSLVNYAGCTCSHKKLPEQQNENIWKNQQVLTQIQSEKNLITLFSVKCMGRKSATKIN